MLEMIVEMMKQIDANGDGYLDIHEDGNISFDVNDFDGFDASWSEVEHEFKDKELVYKLLDLLEHEADEVEGDFYKYYHFGNVTIALGFTSFEI